MDTINLSGFGSKIINGKGDVPEMWQPLAPPVYLYRNFCECGGIGMDL